MAATSHGQFIWQEFVTTDPRKALDFYTHVVGWTSESRPMASGGMYHRLLAQGRGMGGVFPVTQQQQDAGMKTGWVGYITSADVDADCARIRTLGGKVYRPPEDLPNVGRMAPVADPQGAGFILFKPQPAPGEIPQAAEGSGSLGWTELYTSDWKAAFAFYSELFGWKKSTAMDMGPLGTYQLFGDGSKDIGGMMNQPQPGAGSVWNYYFVVDALDAAISRLQAKGGRVLVGPQEVPGGAWVVTSQDSLGGTFSLTAPKR